jgi:alkylhydroperoxidase/carboxymuconolactone decarboxylase family protein YurZ
MSQQGTDDKARSEALIARMKEARGYIYPEWEFAARQDPEFVETYNRIYELGLGEGKHVPAKVREFVAIALLAFRGSDKAGLVAHMKRAIRLGRPVRSCSRCSKPVSSRAGRRRFTGD